VKNIVSSLVILVACSVGCTKKVTLPEPEQGRAVADSFMDLVCTGKAAQAWEGTSTEFKSAEGKESFVRSVKKRPWLAKKATFETSKVIPSAAGERAEYIYKSADAKHQIRLLIANSATGWCIDRMEAD
jgi:hypothetical protein